MFGHKEAAPRIRALLADDNHGNVAAAKGTLQGSDVEMDAVDSLDRALKKLRNRSYDCVVIEGDLLASVGDLRNVVDSLGSAALVVLVHSERPASAEAKLPKGAVFLASSRMRSMHLAQILEECVAAAEAMREGQVDAVMVPGVGTVSPRFQSADDYVYRGLIDALRNGIVTTDAEGWIVFTNKSTGEILGCNPDALLGYRLADIAVADSALLAQKSNDARMGQPGRLELDMRAPSGELAHVLMEIVPLPLSDGGVGLCVTMTDLSREKELRDELQAMAVTDALTGVPNRRLLSEALRMECKRAQRYSRALTCLMIDVDRFKECNDTHGHLVGDMMLRRVAQVIKEEVRDTDVVARFGGDEFCVILSETDLEGALVVAERIRASVEGHPLDSQLYDSTDAVGVTVSIGVFSPRDKSEKEPDVVINGADAELRRSKLAGRNRVSSAAAPSQHEVAASRNGGRVR